MTSTNPDTPTERHTPHLTMAHHHLALLVNAASRDGESQHALSFRIDDVPDLLFILANLMLSYLEDETGERAAPPAAPPWLMVPGMTGGSVVLDGADPTVRALVKLLDTLAGRPTPAGAGNAEPTPDDGTGHVHFMANSPHPDAGD
jgi:hypothetical protein